MKTSDEIRLASRQLREDQNQMYRRHAKENEEIMRRRKAIEDECPHELVNPRRHTRGFYDMCMDCGKDLG